MLQWARWTNFSKSPSAVVLLWQSSVQALSRFWRCATFSQARLPTFAPPHYPCALSAQEQSACIIGALLSMGHQNACFQTRAFPVSLPVCHYFLVLSDVSLLAVNSRLLSESGGPCECSDENSGDPGCVFYDPQYEECIEMFRRELVTVGVFPIWCLCQSAILKNAQTWDAASYVFVYLCLREIENVWGFNSIILSFFVF